MRISIVLAASLATLALALPAAADAPDAIPAVHDELSRTLEELAGQIHGLGERWREHFGRGATAGERPLITLMLAWRHELGLTPVQVEALERLRADFQREAIRRDADLRLAEMDLAGILRTEPVDMAKAETKVREIERLRAETRLARIRTIEQGKAQLTSEQRSRLAQLLAEPPAPRAGQPGGSRL
ncbi:MAG TPA: hypothetical protein VFN71_06895 [Methylomirabilota bacterium]|nr:hypothetical protein [Methylomirabilota bacterium]